MLCYAETEKFLKNLVQKILAVYDCRDNHFLKKIANKPTIIFKSNIINKIFPIKKPLEYQETETKKNADINLSILK